MYFLLTPCGLMTGNLYDTNSTCLVLVRDFHLSVCKYKYLLWLALSQTEGWSIKIQRDCNMFLTLNHIIFIPTVLFLFSFTSLLCIWWVLKLWAEKTWQIPTRWTSDLTQMANFCTAEEQMFFPSLPMSKRWFLSVFQGSTILLHDSGWLV